VAAVVPSVKQEAETKQETPLLSPSPPEVAKPMALRRSHTATITDVTAVAPASPSVLARLSTDGDAASPAWRSVLIAHMRSLLTKADGEVDGSKMSPSHRSLLDSIKSDRAPASPLLLSERAAPDSPSSRLSSSAASLPSPLSTVGSLSSSAAADSSRSGNDDSGEDSNVDDDSELGAEAVGGRSMQENQQQQQQQTASSPLTQPRPALSSSVSAATPLVLSCMNGFHAGVVGCSVASVSSPSESCSPRKRRISKACIACRGRKRKCDGRSPSCSSCQRLQQRCDYPVSKRRGPQVGMLQKRRAELRQKTASSSSRPAEQLRPALHQHTQHMLPPPSSPLLFPYALAMQPVSASVFPRPAATSPLWPVMPLQR
jgi:hypothetical protein